MTQLSTKQHKLIPQKSTATQFKVYLLEESNHLVMIILFFTSVFAIVHYIQITLITIISASKLLVVFGLAGFAFTFLIRNKFKLTIIDGLYYNVFGAAPILMSLFLVINASCSDIYTERHRVVSYTMGGSGYTYKLENDAYQNFWRIRNMQSGSIYKSDPHITFTFCDGILGYKVLKEASFE